jgi:hypothetical protein
VVFVSGDTPSSIVHPRREMTPPNPELLRSLGRLVRGLSALFWGLPLALLVCVQTAKMDGLQPLNVFPPLICTGLLIFGLFQVGSFQPQERPWSLAADRAKLLALINCGLSPFLFWWNRVPNNLFFTLALGLLMLCGVLFLFSLNVVLLRLVAMLPDEALRDEVRQFTALNRTLLVVLVVLAALVSALVRIPNPPEALIKILMVLDHIGIWTLCLLVLPPLAMTMALIWKTKEVVLEGVFGAQ